MGLRKSMYNDELSGLDELRKDIYEKDNYKEVLVDAHKNVCYIFFSSNAIFFPDTKESFYESIIERDRYEWENICKSKEIIEKAGKILFIRDIYKSFYVQGINSSINSIDKLIQFIEEKTNGYKVIVVGNSAGGYMAMLIGWLIGAQSVFCFAGQVSLFEADNVLERYTLLRKYKYELEYNKYFDIRKYHNPNVEVFYFYAAKCENDLIQKKLCDELVNVHKMGFDSKKHGITMYSANMPYVLSRNNEKLNLLFRKYGEKTVSREVFYVHTQGFWAFCVMYMKNIFKLISRK